MLPPATEYQSPTVFQLEVIARLLAIDVNLARVVISTQKEAKPLIELSSEIQKMQAINKKNMSRRLSDADLQRELSGTIRHNSKRWVALKRYLDSDYTS